MYHPPAVGKRIKSFMGKPPSKKSFDSFKNGSTLKQTLQKQSVNLLRIHMAQNRGKGRDMQTTE
jgi:hypothetical protein